MKTQNITLLTLLGTLLLGTGAQAQSGVTPVQKRPAGHHPKPNLPPSGFGNPGRSIPGGTQEEHDYGAGNLLTAAGKSAAAKGDWEQAKSLFLQALEKYPSTYPGDYEAQWGMVQYYQRVGDSAGELKYYRAFTYQGEAVEANIRTLDTTKLLTYALLLNKAGQTAEAITIYNYAAMILKYVDSKPSKGYLLPLFGTEQGQIAYRSTRLQALAQVGLGVSSQATQELTPAERVVHLKEAARLYPNSPVVQSYLGDVLEGAGDAAGAKAARTKADSLGLSRVRGLLDAQTAIMQEQKGVK